MGGGLIFNHDLCVFEEDEDPLQNSLHLEDLPNLAASTLNHDSHSETSSTNSCSAVVQSPIRPRTLNISYLMPDEDIHGVKNFTNGSFEVQGSTVVTDDATSVASELDILPHPPSFEEENHLDDSSKENKCSLPSNKSESSFICHKSDTAEILKQLEEDEHNIQKLTRSSLHLLAGNKNGRANANGLYTNIGYLVKKEQNLLLKKGSHDNSDSSCSYSIPVLNSSSSGDTAMSSLLGYKLSQGLKKTKITNKKKLLNSDSVSCASSSSTSFSSRFSQAITPNWMKKRKEKNREKKNALTRARELMFLRNNQPQLNNTFNDDDSIVTSVQIKSEPSIGAIIKNMEELKLLSTNRKKIHGRVEEHFLNDSYLDTPSVGSLSTSTTITSIKSTSKMKNLMIAKPHALTIQNRMHSAPVLKSSRPSNLVMKKRSTSDSPVVVARKSLSQRHRHFSQSEIRLTKRNQKVITVAPRSISSSKSSRSTFNRFRPKKGLPSKPKVPISDSSMTHLQQNKTVTKLANTIPYPIIHFDQNSNFDRSIKIPEDDDTVSCISIESSFDTLSMSGAHTSSRNTPIKNISHRQPVTVNTPTESSALASRHHTGSLVGMPTSLGRCRSDQNPSTKTLQTPALLRRTQSLQPSEPRLNHLSRLNTSLSSLDGAKYASHLISTPSSVGSHALHASTATRSLSSFLQSPSRYSSLGCQNDASSIASGVSLASTYTALSNLSYKDPCAKPSKTIKRSNLDISGKGDGDIWVEKIFISKRTGKHRTFFISVATGRRIRDEPPTGASKVIYQDDLKEMRRIEAEESRRSNTTTINFGTMASC